MQVATPSRLEVHINPSRAATSLVSCLYILPKSISHVAPVTVAAFPIQTTMEKTAQRADSCADLRAMYDGERKHCPQTPPSVCVCMWVGIYSMCVGVCVRERESLYLCVSVHVREWFVSLNIFMFIVGMLFAQVCLSLTKCMHMCANYMAEIDGHEMQKE